MEPPEKRNANSNDAPSPCQGGFGINYKRFVAAGAGFQARPDTIDIPFGYFGQIAHNSPDSHRSRT